MRILVVEDDDEVSRCLKRSLELEFYAVDIAKDGEIGSFFARTNDYDLVVLDTSLPKKDGLRVCKEVRAAGRNMPILVVSERCSTLAMVEILNAGADDCMAKPYVFEELLARMRALLRRPLSIESDVLLVLGLELDVKTGSATYNGKALHLTRKEFMLLQYLMRNAGSVLSRSMILEHVWDMSVDIFSNTIESHILTLRKKLEDTGPEKLIQTVPGRGYRMSA